MNTFYLTTMKVGCETVYLLETNNTNEVITFNCFHQQKVFANKATFISYIKQVGLDCITLKNKKLLISDTTLLVNKQNRVKARLERTEQGFRAGDAFGGTQYPNIDLFHALGQFLVRYWANNASWTIQ